MEVFRFIEIKVFERRICMKKVFFLCFLFGIFFLSSCSNSKYKNMTEAAAKREFKQLVEFLENNTKFSAISFSTDTEDLNLVNYYDPVDSLELGSMHTYDLKTTLTGKSIEYIYKHNMYYKYDYSSDSIMQESMEMIESDFRTNYMCEQAIKVDLDSSMDFDYEVSSHKNLWNFNSTYSLSIVSTFEEYYMLSFIFLGNEYIIHKLTMSIMAIEYGSKTYSFTGITEDSKEITIIFQI